MRLDLFARLCYTVFTMNDSINGSKTLITGISGFIAGHLAQALAKSGAQIIGTGRRPPTGEVAKACRFVPLDIRDFDQTLAMLQKEKPDTVYHLAATAFLHAAAGGNGAQAMLQTNGTGTQNVLEACRRADVPVLVCASSDKQYGTLAHPPYDDADTTAFLNGGVYELSKAQADQTARLYAGLYDTPSVRIARLVNIYGPNDLEWSRIVPGTIRRTIQGEPPKITSGRAGAALREYVFVDDAVFFLQTLAQNAKQIGNAPFRRSDGKLARVAFNLPSGGQKYAAAQVIEAIQTVLRAFGVDGPPPEVSPGTPGVFEPGDQFGTGDKFFEIAPDFSPRSLLDGLRQTAPWYLEHLKND